MKGIDSVADPDPGGQPDDISESLKNIYGVHWVKILKFFDTIWDPGWKNSDPGSGMEKRWIRHPG